MLSSQNKFWIVIAIVVCFAICLLVAHTLSHIETGNVPEWQQLSDYRASVYKVLDE